MPPARYCPARRPSKHRWHVPLLRPALGHAESAGTSASSMVTTTSTVGCVPKSVVIARAPATTPSPQWEVKHLEIFYRLSAMLEAQFPRRSLLGSLRIEAAGEEA